LLDVPTVFTIPYNLTLNRYWFAFSQFSGAEAGFSCPQLKTRL